MAQKRNVQRERQIGKTKKPEKNHLIDPRYKNTFWTLVVIVVLIIFFILNNTGEAQQQGPPPPGYNPQNLQERLNADVPQELRVSEPNEKK